MKDAKFILSKNVAYEKTRSLLDLGLKISYSYKTNHEVGDVLQDSDLDVYFSIHAKEEINMIKDKSKIIFFIQAEDVNELKNMLKLGLRNFVVDNELDFNGILQAINEVKCKISLSLRMKISEHRIGSGKYFVYGMSSDKVNSLIVREKDNPCLEKIGVHIHRKSQNTSEWNVVSELKDSLSNEVLNSIDFVNLGGGLPAEYKSYSSDVLPYIFNNIRNVIYWLKEKNIDTFIEPGRFIAAPCVKLETTIIQIQENNIILNTTLYNCALDTLLTGTKMIVEGELLDSEDGEYFLIKGNSPTRDDIFRYKVKLKNPKVGDKIIFLNAGAYNYSTDFFGYKKLETVLN